MRAFFGRMNPTLRGLLIVALIALVVVVLQLETTLSVISALLSIAFILAITFFVYLVWRERREDIATWSELARATFYGAALLIIADLLAWSFARRHALDDFAFVVVLLCAGFAMWRVWRDQRSYS